MNQPDPVLESLSVLAQIVRIFQDIGVEYFVTGSIASSVRGEFRATNDIDIVAALDTDSAEQLAIRASTDFFADEQAILQAVREKRSFNLIHKKTVLKVDIFTRLDELAREQLLRAGTVTLPGTDIDAVVLSAEDIILSKLIWYRKGDCQSERQWRDICGVIDAVGDSLDLDYLKRWSNKLGLESLFEKALLA